MISNLSLALLSLCIVRLDAAYYFGDYYYYSYYYGNVETWSVGTMQNFLFEGPYVLKTRPGIDEKLITNVSITVKLNGLSDLDERYNDYQVGLELAQKWRQPKWSLEDLFQDKWKGEFLEMDAPYLYGRIWTPGTYFVNEHSRLESGTWRWRLPSPKHKVTVPSARMRLQKDGTVLHVERLTVRMVCNQDLRRYPLDRQVCPMKISSYQYTSSELVYNWNTEFGAAVLFNKNTDLVEYEIVQIDTSEGCESIHRTDTYSCLEVDIHIRRRLGSYLLQFYFPSFFFVVLSWLTFWIDIESIVGRVGFALFLVVNMAAQMIFALKRLPPVAYIKAIDIWLATCLAFICCALVEYAYIKVRMREVAVKTGRRMTSFFPKVSSSEEEESEDESEDFMEVAAVTKKQSEESGEYIELPAVTTKPPESEESDDYIELPAVTTTVKAKPGILKAATRPTEPETKPATKPAVQVRRQSFKLPPNPTLMQKVAYRIRRKIRQWKSNEALFIDVISRVAFPVAFTLFNFVYWSYYLSSY